MRKKWIEVFYTLTNLFYRGIVLNHMETEETVLLQIDSAKFACKQADILLAQYKQARTNKERAKLLPLLESIKGRLLLEGRFIDQMIENECGGEEEEDRGF